jgi:peptidoglycan/xylan/chitin deacetylase (PgdA/CDA1 family)
VAGGSVVAALTLGLAGSAAQPPRSSAPPPPAARPAAGSRFRVADPPVAGRRLEGSCTIVGTAGDDRIRGTNGDDVICSGRGNDVVDGRSGADTLVDLAGRDVLRGGLGPDVIRVRDGRPYDRIDGGAGVDLCVGDSGDARLHCTHPLDPRHVRRVPVLTYHVVGDPAPGTPLTGLWVSAHALAAQMGYLGRHHYHVVTLQEVYDYWHGGPLPSHPVVVSFDDGFRGYVTKALPILRADGWSGTLNLAVSHYPSELRRRMILRLLNANWELDSHSLTHARLPGLGAARLRAEVAGSRQVLRRIFRVPVNFFCYPYGAFDGAVVTAVRRAGYLGATTTEPGRASRTEPYTLNRIQILRGDGLARLAAKLGAT